MKKAIERARAWFRGRSDRRRGQPSSGDAELPENDIDLATAQNELAAWRIAKLINPNGFAGVVRIRMSRPELVDLSGYVKAIEITWRNESGEKLPSKNESKEQAAFEEALGDLDFPCVFSRLMQVSTAQGTKTWLYYSSDQARFMAVLNRRLTGHRRYPIEIQFYDDPDWRIWQEVADALKDRSD